MSCAILVEFLERILRLSPTSNVPSALAMVLAVWTGAPIVAATAKATSERRSMLWLEAGGSGAS